MQLRTLQTLHGTRECKREAVFLTGARRLSLDRVASSFQAVSCINTRT